MPFTPSFEVTKILKDSSAIYVRDITPTDETSGYGSPGAPSDPGNINSAVLTVASYSGDPVTSTILSNFTLDTLTEEVGYGVAVPDGVATVQFHYGSYHVINLLVSSDRLTLTTDAPDLFTGASYVGDGSSLIEIDTVFETTVTLKSKYPGTASTITGIYIYFTAELNPLVLNKAERAIARSVQKASMHPNSVNLNKAMLLMILRETAQTEYTLLHYAKANEAALLISGQQPVVPSNCSCE